MPRDPRPWYRKSTGWWMAQIGGRQVKLAKGRKAVQAAKDRLADLVKITRVSPDVGGDLTILSLVDIYLEHAEQSLGKRTYTERKRILERLAMGLGDRRVSACIPYNLNEWLDQQKTWGPWAQSSAVKAVQTCLNWGVSQGIIESNPFKGVRRSEGERRRPITDEEYQSLMRHTASEYGKRQRPSPGARFRQVMVFLRFSGARPYEAYRLRWEHIDFDRAEIVLHEHKTAKTQKVKRPRIIPLHPVVVKLFLWIRKRESNEWVFVNYRGKPWTRTTLSQRLQASRELAGIPENAKLYGLRHHFGTMAIINGVDLVTLSHLLGHTKTKQTEYYLHLADQRQHLADAMRQVSRRRPKL